MPANCGCVYHAEENIPCPHDVALERYKGGERPSFSTGVDELISVGYGQLDHNGFWEYPLLEAHLNPEDLQLVQQLNERSL